MPSGAAELELGKGTTTGVSAAAQGAYPLCESTYSMKLRRVGICSRSSGEC